MKIWPTYSFWRAVLLAGAISMVASNSSAQVSVLTQHNDNARTGLNPSETILTTSNVNVAQFGKVFSLPVDGQVYAQPLYAPNVVFPGNVSHNVVIVATQNDSVYAFDADSNTGANATPLWKANLVDSAHGGAPGETAFLNAPATTGCTAITPEIGVISTPVIDLTTSPTPTIYVVAKSLSGSNFINRLHALDLTTGNEKPQGPTVIVGSVSGNGDASQNGTLTFNPQYQFNRPGILLLNGNVYVGFASVCYPIVFHGWIFSYDAASFAQKSVYVTTPNGVRGGIWMSGAGLAADSGYIYTASGDGTYDTAAPITDFGDSILKLATSNAMQGNGYLSLSDYFTPYNQGSLLTDDTDLGSGGVLLLPDQPGSHPHELVQAGKQGRIYLLDRDRLTSNPSSPAQEEPYCSNCANDPQIVQESPFNTGAIFGAPAYWNNNIYYWGVGDVLRSIPISNGLLNYAAMTTNSSAAGYPAPIPAISSNGAAAGTGILWAIDTSQQGSAGPAVVYAYDASNLRNLLWTSSQSANSRDRAGPAAKFATPTIVNGKVYVGTTGEVDVYGLLPVVTPSGVQLGPAQTQQFTVNEQNLAGQTVAWSIISVVPSGAAQGSFSNTTPGLYIAPVNITAPETVTVQAALNGAAVGTAVINLVPGPIVNFITADPTTQGNWQGIYGADGYALANVTSQKTPAYATFAVQNQQNWTWASGTSDTRGLQLPGGSGRIAATWYQAGIFNFDVNVTDGNAHQIALYAVDWDAKGRSESVQIIDANTNAVLSTQNISNFTGGVYLVWGISGHVKINVTWTGGANAAISGIFFGGAVSTGPSGPALSILKTHSGSFSQGQQGATYTVTVSNGVGASPTSGLVTVTETMPSGLSLVSMAGSEWSCGSNTCTRSDPLSGGASYPSITVTVNVTSNATSPQVNQVSVSGGGSTTTTPTSDSTAIITTGGDPTSASFLGFDSSTQGNWIGVYGQDGYSMALGATQLPSYVPEVTPENQVNYLWASSTTDVRALETDTKGGRLAATWYNNDPSPTFSLDVDVAGTTPQRVALYAVDFTFHSRVETVQIVDASTGTPLDSETIANFTTGIYLIWNISGHVIINVICDSGENAVISAVLFGGTNPLTTVHFLPFVAFDSATKGNWQAAYGADGYALANVATQKNPVYGSFQVQNQQNWAWASGSSDSRALQIPGGSGGIAATWYNATSFTFNVNVTDGAAHRLALYALDWDHQNRAETIQLVDAKTNAVLNTQYVSNFTNGIYLAWDVSGQVKIVVTRTSGVNAAVSAIFFDPVGGSGSGGGGGGTESVSVSPQNASLNAGGTQQFTATVTNGASQAVTWTIGLVSPTGAAPGTFSTTTAGLYLAPGTVSVAETVQIQATSADGKASGTATVTLTPATQTGGATATFVKTDTQTEGNWQSAYGSEGDALANFSPQNIPSYAAFQVQGQSNWTWASNTADPRALRMPGGSGGIAAGWYGTAYGPSAFSFDVNFTGSHQLALYAVDWDNVGRTETIQILDAVTKTQLDSRQISKFTNGIYLVWNISGHVTVNVVLNGGPNAVVSGVFFEPTIPSGPASPALGITKTHTGSFAQGQNGAIYTVTVSNSTSAGPTSGQVTVTETVPSGLSLVSMAGTAWSCASNTCTRSDTLNAGASFPAITVTVNVASNAVSPQVNQVSVSGGGSATASATDSTPITAVGSGGPSAASFVGFDQSTQGNWIGVYGQDGYSMALGTTVLPSYVPAVTPENQLNYLWEASTTDIRALETNTTGNRLATTWYNALQCNGTCSTPTFSLDVNITAATPQRVALYAVDYTFHTRVQTVQIVDAVSGTQLDSEAISNFTNGIYLIWNISGHVIINITNVSGENAVISGIFFGGTSAPTTTTFIKSDAATQGNWIGKYGADGYSLANSLQGLPPYVPPTFTIDTQNMMKWTWAGNTTDNRALETNTSGNRIAATYYSSPYVNSTLVFDLNFTDGNSHQVALYAVDWDRLARAETITVLDGTSVQTKVLDTESVTTFGNGTYLVWNVSGHVIVTVTLNGGANAVVSGVFFDKSSP